MDRQFPNLLNEKEVIQLANHVVLDESIASELNQQKGQFGNQEQFVQSQNKEHVYYEQYWHDQNQAMVYPYYCLCPCCQWMGYHYH